MAATYPGGGSNTYVPSTDATNNMVVEFSRNPKSFPLNKYISIVPVTKDQGLYTLMTNEEAGRILDTSLADHFWADGEDEPESRGKSESFEFKPYATKRLHFGFRLGKKSSDQASWQIVAQHSRIKVQQAMTGRTQLAVTLLTTTGNYAAANTSAVSSISGVTGKWDVSTTARMDIKKSLDYGRDIIFKSTLGGVSMDDFVFVISAGCARLISTSQEIVDYIKQSPAALDYIKGNLGPNAQFGLPEYLYGCKLVIENTVKATNRKGATKATSYVMADTVGVLVCRPGSLVKPEDSNAAPSFSSATLFAYEDMTVETKTDTDNRLEKGRVVEDYALVLTAPASAFLFTAATG